MGAGEVGRPLMVGSLFSRLGIHGTVSLPPASTPKLASSGFALAAHVRLDSRRASAPATALPERRQGGDRPQATRAQNRGDLWRHRRHPELVSRAVADRPLAQSLLSL